MESVTVSVGNDGKQLQSFPIFQDVLEEFNYVLILCTIALLDQRSRAILDQRSRRSLNLES